MAESDDARVLLDRAADDLEMLEGMIGVGLGTDAIFGFHAQQAVEKAAKAWLLAVTAFGVEFRHGPVELAGAVDRADLARRVGAYVQAAQSAVASSAG